MTYELAMQDLDGAWELIGDHATEAEAIEDARKWAATFFAAFPKAATLVFGISPDPASGHYETRLEFDRDGNTRMS